MVDLSIKIHELELKNPVATASGTFGYGEEFSDFFDPGALGAIFIKGLTLNNHDGNPYPRMAETASGMLNAVGLQNKGINHFIENIYPRIKNYNTHIIANVNGSTVEEYVALTEKINELEHIPAIELNISCPNVKEGGMAFGVSCPSAVAVTEAVREVYDKTLIVKLSPNVTDIAEMALAVEGAGAGAVIGLDLGCQHFITTDFPLSKQLAGMCLFLVGQTRGHGARRYQDCGQMTKLECTHEQTGQDFVAYTQQHNPVKYVMGQANHRGHGYHVAAEQAQIHSRLALGDAVAHGRHTACKLGAATGSGNCLLDDVGVVAIGLVG